MYSFMDVDTIPEPQEDVFPISPSPANEEHPPGSSDEDESDDEEEEAGSKGERLRRGADDMTILDIDDELADDKVPLPLQIPSGYSFVSSVPAALIAALVKQSIMLRLGVDWLMDHHATGSSAHTPPLRLQRVPRQRRQHAQREAAVGKVLRGRDLGGGIFGATDALRGRPWN
ncbi:unnamed protein product [Ascophyllum nodosum]